MNVLGVPSGYTLAVTLEIADATLGGLAMGVGMTTYSHKVHWFSLSGTITRKTMA